MKNLILFLSICLLLSSCRDKIYHKYMANSPIYMDYATFRNSITFEEPKAIEDQTGIFKMGQNLFIVENEKGIHFIDNSNPNSPKKLGYLSIQGCTGISIKGNFLYANNLIDLVVIDISDIQNPQVVGRAENEFPDEIPHGNSNYQYAQVDSEKGLVIGWELKEVKEDVSESPNDNNSGLWYTMIDNGGLIANIGHSGSITKFAILNDYLYIMNGFDMHPFDISSPIQPVSDPKFRISRVVESLFPHNNHLFMGTQTGMIIYSTASPGSPVQIGTIDHVTACDPVVVQGNYAYVTIRTGATCAGNLNQLDVIDISNLSSPILENSFPMENPHGLGIENNTLFICDGDAGLKVFDATNPLDCGNQLQQTFSSIVAIDIIPHNNTAIVLAEDGIYQYDYSNINNIQFLSKIQ